MSQRPPKNALKAKCPENQAALGKLVAQRAKAHNTNFSFTMKRAIESLMSAKEPVTTYKEALALAYVGPYIAKIIAPPAADVTRKRARKAPPGSDAAPSLSQESSSSTVATTTQPKKRRRPPPPAASAAAPIDAGPSAKELAYEKAKAAALDWKKLPYPLKWRVMLIVDGREKESQHIQAKCQMSGIPCEERHLAIGDMAWIAQGEHDHDTTSTKKKSAPVELMLGTIIERKTTEDLKSSLFGTRYAEQRLRLQHSGLPQVLFLIEGDLSRELFRCPSDTLHSAVWETRMHLGFQIVHTAHMDDTVKTLKRMHRRILQRTFPRAFSTEALPTFAEADASNSRQRRESLDDQRRRRRRRRIQSLVEMTFDEDPTPPFGTERFISYKELKAKVERDREMGTKTVGNLHMAMLKQVASYSSKKCQAVARAYPTAGRLLAAYDQQDDIDSRKTLVADIVTSDAVASARELKIGPRSAEELYIAYGLAGEEDETQHQSSSSNVASNPAWEEDQQTSQAARYAAKPAWEDQQASQAASYAAKPPAREKQRSPQSSPESNWHVQEEELSVDASSIQAARGKKKKSSPPREPTTAFGRQDSETKRARVAAAVESRMSRGKENACVDLTLSPVRKLSPAAAPLPEHLDLSFDTSMEITPARFGKPSKRVAVSRIAFAVDSSSSEDDGLESIRMDRKRAPDSNSSNKTVEIIELD